jgi:DNA-binding NarL/FixJ family response regulator
VAIQIVLADDHQIVRDCLRGLLEREGFTVVGGAADGQQAVELVEKHEPDIVVLDLTMPQLNGVDAARRILQVCPRTIPILLTMHTAEHHIAAALRAGIRGYVVKTQAAEDLIHAIREVLRGGIYLSPRISNVVVEACLSNAGLAPDPLAPREREVLQLIAEGKTTKQVASLLGLSVKTVESYRARIMEKLDIHETASLVRYAIRRGLIQA